MRVKKVKTRGLPKFDSTAGLGFGIFFSLMLFGDNLWSLIAGWNQPFFPFQFGKILGIAIGIGLGIHCIDMIRYYQKHGRLGEYQNHL